MATSIGTQFLGSDACFSSISVDTRTLQKGALFVALKGQQVDGHAFVKEAEAKGASGVLVSEKVHTTLPVLQVSDTLSALGQLAQAYRKTFPIPIVAITGSCGKTTVKEMLFKILSRLGSVLATQGNFNTEIGVPLTLSKLNATHRCAIIEMGARKENDIAYLMQLAAPEVSILTNAGTAHIEIFGNEQAIAKAKGEIFQCLDPKGTAVMNADDKQYGYWKSLLQGQKIISFGIDNKADIIGVPLCDGYFDLITDIGKALVQLQVSGKHNVMNALAAAAGARALGVSLENIQRGLEAFSAVPGRLENKKGVFGACVIDDTYNANPSSVTAALDVLSKCVGQKILVLGDMKELGSKAAALHYEVGVQAKNLNIDHVLCIGALTVHTAEGYGTGAKHYDHKSTLVQEIMSLLKSNTKSTILVKGSRAMGMEDVVRALC